MYLMSLNEARDDNNNNIETLPLNETYLKEGALQ